MIFSWQKIREALDRHSKLARKKKESFSCYIARKRGFYSHGAKKEMEFLPRESQSKIKKSEEEALRGCFSAVSKSLKREEKSLSWGCRKGEGRKGYVTM